MKIAYLVNQYPKTSHSFIRREIHALESLGNGLEIIRYSIRKTTEVLPDIQDQKECGWTEVILEAGMIQLISTACITMFWSPVRSLSSLVLATRLGVNGHRGLIRHWIYWLEAAWFKRSTRIKGVTHVHAHFGTNSTTVAMLCHELGGPPFSFTVHGPEEFDRPDAIHLAEKIRRCRFVVAISSFGRSQLMRWCPSKEWSKLKVVRCGVDGTYIAAKSTAVGDSITFVCVGRLCEQKGQLLLIEAIWKLVKEECKVHLRLVGDGPMRSECEDAIVTWNLRDHVTITGWATGATVQNEILQARAFVLPSFAEGLPVVIMEALALERPVISTYVAGIPELVRPGENGWLVPAGDVQVLADAMREALETPVERLIEMGKSGRKSVIERHDIRKEVAKLASLFQDTPLP